MPIKRPSDKNAEASVVYMGKRPFLVHLISKDQN